MATRREVGALLGVRERDLRRLEECAGIRARAGTGYTSRELKALVRLSGEIRKRLVRR